MSLGMSLDLRLAPISAGSEWEWPQWQKVSNVSELPWCQTWAQLPMQMLPALLILCRDHRPYPKQAKDVLWE